MDNKKLGFIILVLSVIIGIILILFQNQIMKVNEESCDCNTCKTGDLCKDGKFPYLFTGGLAIIFAILSLGVYLIFFEKSQQIILNKIDKDNVKLSRDDKFNFILLGLDEEEKIVLSAIKEQDGITQQTLRIRTNIHKSKLSLIVSALEEKKLINKEKKGKTNQLFLRVKLD